MHWGLGRLSQVGESQGEGESPSCILPAFFEHLLCASPHSLSRALPHAAWEGFWVCFHEMSSPVPCRAGPGHLQGLMAGLPPLPGLAAAASPVGKEDSA